MKKVSFKIVALGTSVPLTAVTFFLLWQSYSTLRNLSIITPHTKSVETHGEAKAEAHGGGHGEAKAEAHGGGHGEAKAEAHGGGHGEAKAEAHGGGHGEAAAEPEDTGKAGVGLVSISEIFVNIGAGLYTKSLGLKLELELFDESGRGALDKQQSAVKNVVIEASREQDSSRLNTIPGKLYFKETLISRLNTFFREPIIRDVHFSSFYLQ